MIHDKARVEASRARVAAQLELITMLEAKIVKGQLDSLKVPRDQTADTETFFLGDLKRQNRTSPGEARCLSCAEHMVQTWEPYLKQTQEQFSKYGELGIEIVGG